MTRRTRFGVAGALVWLTSAQVMAEGSAEFDVGDTGSSDSHDQAVSTSTTIYVDIRNDAGREKICWTGNGNLTVRAPEASTNLATLTSGSPCVSAPEGTVGAYRLTLGSNQNIGTRWDIRVCADTASNADCRNASASFERKGRVWSYDWSFQENSSYVASRSNNGSVYAVVPGGAVGHDAVIEMQMRGVSGAYYHLFANAIGPETSAGVRVGRSVPTSGHKVTPAYKLYLSPPASSLYNWIEPIVSDVELAPSCGTSVVLDTAPGSISFDSNVEGQYVVVCDVNKDGVYNLASNDDFSSFGAAIVGTNTVTWNGKNNAAANAPVGTYDCIIRLNVGEFHYIAEDIETSYPGIRMYRLESDRTTRTPIRMYWDDRLVPTDSETMNNQAGQLSPSGSPADGLHPGAYGTAPSPFYYSGSTPTGNARAWGNFDGDGKGNDNFLDQFSAADTAQSTPFQVSIIARLGDADNDGLSNARECQIGTDPQNPDTDGDGIRDGDEAPETGGVPDTDGDGIEDPFDTDDDGDGIPTRDELGSSAPGTIDPDDALDSDDDGVPDYLEVDSDGDGVCDGAVAAPGVCVAGPDADPTDPAKCRDLDGDTCDDCAHTGADGSGGDTALDGDDFDGDGACNAGDPDDDDDGICDGAVAVPGVCVAGPDTHPTNPNVCVDSDNDGCDDCALGLGPNPANDGADFDVDGLCNAGDPDDDNDGVCDGAVAVVGVCIAGPDTHPLDSSRCADRDGDGCDDCSAGGGPNPANDGLDTDHDGLCDAGDPDIDDDGVCNTAAAITNVCAAGPDTHPTDPSQCADTDGDGCNDCASGKFDPADDGPDADDDGLCDSGDDTDGDGVPDVDDLDDDNDGVPDALENELGLRPDGDRDGDGIPNYLDAGDRGDGQPNDCQDANSDGRCDAPGRLFDVDGDRVANHLDLDADNDGIADVYEAGLLAFDTNEDGMVDGDVGTNGLLDGLETQADSGTVSYVLLDTDGDGDSDGLDLDSDGDGQFDIAEVAGLAGLDVNGDGRVDSATDADKDGLMDVVDDDETTFGFPKSSSDPRESDADGDKIPDAYDVDDAGPGAGDSDGDGKPDDVECSAGWPGCSRPQGSAQPDYMTGDRDGDGVPDAVDLDDDNDGILDTVEASHANADADGLSNKDDLDSDGDGLLDVFEAGHGGPDTDHDGRVDGPVGNNGVPDAVEQNGADSGVVPAPRDSDSDGKPDFVDADDDGDGIPTKDEAADPNGDGDPSDARDTDGDGVPDYLDPDDDGDGVPTKDESPRGDTDGDGTPDYLDPDDDGDGVPTKDELPRGDTDGDGTPDYLDTDDDGDGIPTEQEIEDEDALDGDVDGDGVPAYLDEDSDDDGAPDSVEAGFDLDDDGVPDYLDPDVVVPDTDGDGIADAVECSAQPCKDTDGDGVPDFQDDDDDGDGVPTKDEIAHGDTDGDGKPDYLDPDDDGDGIPTKDELPRGDTDADGKPDYLDPDDDGDGVPTKDELPRGDTDADGKPDSLDPDDDNDGVPTKDELPRGDTDADGKPDYLDPDDDGDGVPTKDELPRGDTDGDGKPDSLDPDDDNDGVLTKHELPHGDTDADGTPDYLDPDDDNDGVPTKDEGADPNGDGNPADARDTDKDGTPDYLDPDDDGDGVPTKDELPRGDSDGDGTPDYLDRDDDGDGVPTAEEREDADGNGVPDYLEPKGEEEVPEVPDTTVAGALAGGALCATTTPGARGDFPLWLALLSLSLGLVLRRRRRNAKGIAAAAGLLLGLLSASQASAQTTLDSFKPAPLASDGFALSRPDVLDAWHWGMLAALDYANDPLVFEYADSSRRDRVVSHQLVAHVGVAVGLGSRLTVFAMLPINALMRGETLGNVPAPKPDGAGIGDVGVGGRLRLVGNPTSVFALSGEFTARVPTAKLADKNQAYLGDKIGSYEPVLIAEVRMGRFDLRGRFGARFRKPTSIGDLELGQELLYGLGARLRLARHLYAHVEVYGSTVAKDFMARKKTPVELLAGPKYQGKNFHFGVAAGPGLVQGYGAPDVRVVGLLGYAGTKQEEPPKPEAPKDTDGDGLFDQDDACPLDPEDKDGFEDHDGCPDPDNDQDGVLDVNDQCPLDPEDADGFQGDDGCPDPDNDQDGLLDVNDQCPLEPEDKDSFQDEDGCPDPDNDGDGVLDVDDECPLTPGVAEAKGCLKSVRVDVEKGQITILERVEFAVNKDVILKSSEPLLQDVATTLASNPQLKVVRVEGHTDSVGADKKNLTLSTRRARSVARWLSEHGIARERLTAFGCGETRPIADNKTKEGKQTNRRVEFHIEDPALADAVPPSSCVQIGLD